MEDKLKGKWHQVKGEVKSRWGKLTDDELTELDGDREKLIGKIQEKYGSSKEDVSNHLDTMLRDRD